MTTGSNSNTLTPLERAALEKILSPENSSDVALRDQLRAVRVASREFTGVGMFIELVVSDDIASPDKNRRVISNVSGEMEGLSHGFGAVLFAEQGKLQMLEFATFDEPWPKQIRNFNFSYIRCFNP